MSNPKVSVIAPTYNRSTIIPRFLSALNCQTVLPEDYEVILVDDGSTDETREVIASLSGRFKFNLKYLYQSNKGQAAARNLGIQKARGSLILILNDDAIVNPDLIEKHLAAHKEFSPRKVAVLGSFKWDEDLISNAFVRYVSQSTAIFQYPRMDRGFYNYKYFWTCNISILKEPLLEAGGFDETFMCPVVHEDVELGYRLQRMGVKVYYDPAILSTHYHPFTLQQFIRREYNNGVNLVKLVAKHPELMVDWGNFFFPHKLRKLTSFIQQNRGKYEEAIRYLEHVEKLNLCEYDELKAKAIKESSGLNHDKQLEDSIKLVHKYEKYKAIIEKLTKNDTTYTIGTLDKANYYFARYILRNITRPFCRLREKFKTKSW